LIILLYTFIDKMTWYKIKCDDGKFREFSESNFISVEEMRNNKLNNLGIE